MLPRILEVGDLLIKRRYLLKEILYTGMCVKVLPCKNEIYYDFQWILTYNTDTQPMPSINHHTLCVMLNHERYDIVRCSKCE